MKTISVIKNNDEIYAALSKRKEELGLTNLDISFEASKYGVKLPVPSLSRYFTRKEESSISEQGILWMCSRYCIEIKIVIEKKEYSDFDGVLNIKIKQIKK